MFRSLLPLHIRNSLNYLPSDTGSKRTEFISAPRLHPRQSLSFLRWTPHVASADCPKGGRGNSRVSPVVEEIITRTIDKVYLTKHKRKASDVIFEIQKRYFGGCDWLT
ncbi:MAG TPA: hypothetical protein V6C91_08200 [Coleofasciculaceae cyanobacterium]